jgi:hypothetical protein
MKFCEMEANGKSYEYWYDRPMGHWYAVEVDEKGNCGPSVHADSRTEIEKIISDDLVPSIKDKDFF